jgi:hypothetical protein
MQNPATRKFGLFRTLKNDRNSSACFKSRRLPVTRSDKTRKALDEIQSVERRYRSI